MKILKKNQIIIYTFALLLITAGYLNYTNNIHENVVETSSAETADERSFNESTSKELEKNTKESSVENLQVSDIGDATLVNSSDVISGSNIKENKESKEDYFIQSKLERDTMYSQMISSYEKVLNSSNSPEEQKQSAAQEITNINQTKNSIMICENLIKTKGFENCVIFVNGDSVSAIIGAETIENEEIAQIQNIISRELNAEIENIHISTK